MGEVVFFSWVIEVANLCARGWVKLFGNGMGVGVGGDEGCWGAS